MLECRKIGHHHKKDDSTIVKIDSSSGGFQLLIFQCQQDAENFCKRINSNTDISLSAFIIKVSK